jgi:hypothetical protein
MKDLKNVLAPVELIAPAAIKTTQAAGNTSVDLFGFEGALVELSSGTWTDGTFAFSLQESSDNTNWNAVSGTDLQGAFTNINSNAPGIQTVGYFGSKRYLSVAVTVTGSPATGMVFGINVIKGHARHNPAGATQTP